MRNWIREMMFIVKGLTIGAWYRWVGPPVYSHIPSPWDGAEDPERDCPIIDRGWYPTHWDEVPPELMK